MGNTQISFNYIKGLGRESKVIGMWESWWPMFLSFCIYALSMHVRMPDLANKNRGCQVKLEFQINK